MLKLSRKNDQSVTLRVCGVLIVVTLSEARSGRASLSIEAPRDSVDIVRSELEFADQPAALETVPCG